MATQPDGIFNEVIDAFFGGISDSPRLQKTEVYQVAQHFDIWSDPKLLTPYYANVNDDTFSSAISGTGNAKNSFVADVVAATNVFTLESGTCASVGIQNGSPVKYTAVSHDVFVQNTVYYAGNVSGSTFKLYSDAALTTVMDATVDTIGMNFDLLSYVSTTNDPTTYGIVSGSALVYTGTTSNGLTQNTTYYAGNLTSTHFNLYDDSGLTTLRVISGTISPATFTLAIDATAFKIVAFAYENSGFFAAGYKTGTTKAKIYQKPTGSAITGIWYGAPNGEDSATDSTGINAFLSYHDYVYGGRTLGIWAYGTLDPSGTFTSTAYSPSGTPNCQGIITYDDLLIIPLSTSLAVKDGAGSGPTDTWSTPISFAQIARQILDLTEWGDFVAVALHPGGGYNGTIGSKVALWDKVSTDPSHMIDWGEGHLLILENLEGTLVGVSVQGYGEEGIIKQKLVVRQYTGGDDAQVIFELEGDAGTSMSIGPNLAKIRESNRVRFPVKFTKDGVAYNQYAAVGRKASGYPIGFTLEQLVDNTSAITSIQGSFKLGQTIFTAFNSDGSINKTDPALSYTTSTYISQKRTGASRVLDGHRRKKQLLMAGITAPPLTSGQSINLYYRADGGSWTLIRTYTYGDDTTSGEVPANTGFEAGSAGTSNDEFPVYKEIEFKATCAGGASVSGFPYSWKLVGAELQTP